MASLHSPLVVALNPSIDSEWRVDNVQWEEKNSIKSERRWAGGKGVNVARWLQHLGCNPRLILPLGSATGRELASFLRSERLSLKKIAIQEPTRVNVIVTTSSGRQLRFNPAGPTLCSFDWAKLFDAVAGELEKHRLMVLSGSLPREAAPDTYAKLILLASRLGRQVILDCDGPALAAAIIARPFLVKPNVMELSQWCRKTVRTKRELHEAARSMARQTKGWVLVSRGADGALLINESENVCFEAKPPSVNAVNTVGAGDALVSAVAIRILEGRSPENWLRHGVAAGTAATQCSPGQLPNVRLIGQLAKQISATRSE